MKKYFKEILFLLIVLFSIGMGLTLYVIDKNCSNHNKFSIFNDNYKCIKL